ncbi:MAG: regulator [Gammaproteobacteria bacterium RBG_16_57_12]|nr:MAG: regulator [Gammaproteobacteria bacterium RBG_16_57_12]
MNIKTISLVLVVGAVVVGAYFLGTKQAGQPVPVATVAQQQPATSPSAMPPAPVAGPSTPVPQGHPSLDRFTHFQVGNSNVKAMLADGDTVWIGTSGGVVRYNLGNDEHKVYNVGTGNLLANGIFHLSKLGNNLLVGTYGGGMSTYNPQTDQWKNYNIPQGLADQFVYDALVTPNGDVWLATWSGANRIRGGNLDDASKWDTFTVENTKGGLPNDWVYGLENGKDGEVWIATEGGLARFKDGKWQHWNHEAGLGEAYEKVKNDINFTNDPGKASKHHATQKTEQGLENVNIAYNPNYIISLKVDKKGIVWAGTWGGGLARFDGKRWQNYTVADGLPANHIFMLYLDKGDNLWIGTSSGLARFKQDGKGFEVKTARDGLFSDNVFSMAEASNGTVWVGSFGGVARLAGL